MGQIGHNWYIAQFEQVSYNILLCRDQVQIESSLLYQECLTSSAARRAQHQRQSVIIMVANGELTTLSQHQHPTVKLSSSSAARTKLHSLYYYPNPNPNRHRHNNTTSKYTYVFAILLTLFVAHAMMAGIVRPSSRPAVTHVQHNGQHHDGLTDEDVIDERTGQYSCNKTSSKNSIDIQKQQPQHPPSGRRSIIFHQILPPDHSKYQRWIDSWDVVQQGREEGTLFDGRVIYGDDDLVHVVESLGSNTLLAGWSAMARTIEKVDFVRYAILYLYGGVYADADQELVDVLSFQTMMESAWDDTSCSIILPYEMGGLWDTQQVGQALMISLYPRHPFWWDLMEYMVHQYNSSCSVLLNTGPLAMTNFWNERCGLTTSGTGKEGQDDDWGTNTTSAIHDKNNYCSTVRLARLLDGHMDPTRYNKSVTIHHMGGSWVQSDHTSQLDACKDRVPYSCFGCEEYSKQHY
jgi:hypothetical protein